MSADDYYFVGQTEDGKFSVSHRFASNYYADEVSEAPMEASSFEGDSEGWKLRGDSKVGSKVFPTLEAAQEAATRRPDWIEEPPKPLAVYDTLEQAVMAAHERVQDDSVNGYPVEYGVCVGVDIKKSINLIRELKNG